MSLIELTTLEGHVVLDPFCGSGSTLVAAKALQRHYIGFDNDPDCVKVARERLAPDIFEAFSGETAMVSNQQLQQTALRAAADPDGSGDRTQEQSRWPFNATGVGPIPSC
jgi:tRNA G10  N-methylase Trm11